jgi:non-ribosomal peptide synthetase component F
VLKAGGAYVPMDARYPVARLAFMAEDAKLTVILSEQALAPAIAPAGRRVIARRGCAGAAARRAGDRGI